jgi:UPF0271 protein
MSKRNRTIILDTSAFIAGFDPFSVDEEQYSVIGVEKELISNTLSWTRFKTSVESGKLKLKKPKNDSIKKVKEISKSLGDINSLSEVDLQVLALALEIDNVDCNTFIITDDYSIQNVANKIGLNFISLVTFGIRFRLYWKLYCPACYQEYCFDQRIKDCEICGTKLKRKSLRRERLKDKKR